MASWRVTTGGMSSAPANEARSDNRVTVRDASRTPSPSPTCLLAASAPACPCFAPPPPCSPPPVAACVSVGFPESSARISISTSCMCATAWPSSISASLAGGNLRWMASSTSVSATSSRSYPLAACTSDTTWRMRTLNSLAPAATELFTELMSCPASVRRRRSKSFLRSFICAFLICLSVTGPPPWTGSTPAVRRKRAILLRWCKTNSKSHTIPPATGAQRFIPGAVM
mmetsp:Transcript_38924/g.96421  ORF Transcript_38924/g.96421 Transcript_38924/m.96421 type:complete len:228 (+) Transcript_38924:426-1109(+)